jgi:hypothetical protein
MEHELDRLEALARTRAASPAPLDRLSAAVLVADELRAQGDELLDRFVAQARRENCSWTEIGTTLGISKQAAHQRFLASEQAAGSWPRNATAEVRAAMVSAQQEARRLGHNYLGTEHALVGLLSQPGGVAAQALCALGVDRDGVLERAKVVIGTGWHAGSDLKVAPRLKRALDIARAHSRALGQRSIHSEHLLLAFCDIEDSLAARLLRELGAPPEAVRAQLAELLRVEPAQLRPRSARRRLRRTRAC